MATKRQRKLRKKVQRLVLHTLLAVAGAVIMFQAFLGAILQESYKLSPITEAELQEVVSK